MNETTQLHLKNIFSKDKELQNAAYTFFNGSHGSAGTMGI